MKYILSILILSLYLASPVFGAITFDAVTTLANVDNSDTLEFSHTVGGGCSDPAIFVSIQFNKGGYTLGAVSSVSVGGSAGASAGGVTDGESERRFETWYRAGVSTGSNTITITLDGTQGSIEALAKSYCGVNSSTPIGTASAIATIDYTITTTVTSANDELVMDDVVIGWATGNGLTVDGAQTERAHYDPGDSWIRGSSDKPGALSTTMTWTEDMPSYVMYIVVPIKPAAGAPPPSGQQVKVVIVE